MWVLALIVIGALLASAGRLDRDEVERLSQGDAELATALRAEEALRRAHGEFALFVCLASIVGSFFQQALVGVAFLVPAFQSWAVVYRRLRFPQVLQAVRDDPERDTHSPPTSTGFWIFLGVAFTLIAALPLTLAR